MTLQEFKAWFEGFTEGMERAPNLKQWTRITKRVKEIDGTPVTERVFIDRYWPKGYPYYPFYWNTLCGSGAPVPGSITAYHGAPTISGVAQQQISGTTYNAMYTAGKADQMSTT